MKGRLKLFSIVAVIGLFLLSPLKCLGATNGGYDITSSLWAKAVLWVPGFPVTLKWNVVGTDITPSGDQVISGYFYADHHHCRPMNIFWAFQFVLNWDYSGIWVDQSYPLMA